MSKNAIEPSYINTHRHTSLIGQHTMMASPRNCGRTSPRVIDLVSPNSSKLPKKEDKPNGVIDLLLSDDDRDHDNDEDNMLGIQEGSSVATAATAAASTSLKRARDYSPDSLKHSDHTLLGEGHVKRPFRDTNAPTSSKSSCDETNSIARHNTFSTPPLVVIRDDGEVTTDLLSLLDKLCLPMAVTCTSRFNAQQLPSNFLPNDESNKSYCSLLLHHIQQKDKWSCGFRNLQMLLTALLPYYHQMQTTSTEASPTRVIDIPTVTELQNYLEECWAAGYDPRGAEHYQYRIVGKCSQIGAVEVSSVLTHQLGLDSTVIQFIKCIASRRLLPQFVWNYFHSTMGATNQCYHCRHLATMTASERAKSLLEKTPNWLSSSVHQKSSANHTASRSNKEESSRCHCPVLPLYLQWEGHSVTIVGIEQKSANGSATISTNAISNGHITSGMKLLVFDPGHNGQIRKKELERGNPFRMRLDCLKLCQKDCQIVMCVLRSLSQEEKMARKRRIESVTASKEAVMRVS